MNNNPLNENRLKQLMQEAEAYKDLLALIWSEQDLAQADCAEKFSDEYIERIKRLGQMEREVFLRKLFPGLTAEEVYSRVYGG